MQTKKFLVIGISLLVLLSLFQLTDMIINDGNNIQEASYIRLKYLIFSYGFMLMMLAAFFFIETFQNLILVLFLFCLNVTVAFTVCEEVVSHLPMHQKESLLVFHKISKYQRNVEASYLSLFFLTYMYSVIGTVLLGIFLIARCLLIKWYEHKLMKQLQSHIIPIVYSSDLKGMDCTICLNQYDVNDQNLFELKHCHHIFHSKCIQEWINYSTTCPICRNSILPARRSRQSLD